MTHFLPTLPKGQAISVAAGKRSATRGIKAQHGVQGDNRKPVAASRFSMYGTGIATER